MTPEVWALQAELLLERLQPAAFACCDPALAEEIGRLLTMRRAIDTTPPAPRVRCWVCQAFLRERGFGEPAEPRPGRRAVLRERDAGGCGIG